MDAFKSKYRALWSIPPHGVSIDSVAFVETWNQAHVALAEILRLEPGDPARATYDASQLQAEDDEIYNIEIDL